MFFDIYHLKPGEGFTEGTLLETVRETDLQKSLTRNANKIFGTKNLYSGEDSQRCEYGNSENKIVAVLSERD